MDGVWGKKHALRFSPAKTRAREKPREGFYLSLASIACDKGSGDCRPRYARPQHARRLCVPPHRRDVSDPSKFNDLLVSKFERQDGTPLFGSDPLTRFPQWREKYNTATLPASQHLFFRGENHAWVQTATGGIVKPDSNQTAIPVTHPDGLILPPPARRFVSEAERDTMKRLSRLVFR